MYTSTLRPFIWAYLVSAVVGSCPPFKGSFNATILDLYPENADWDPVHCKIYFGYVVLFSCSGFRSVSDERQSLLQRLGCCLRSLS